MKLISKRLLLIIALIFFSAGSFASGPPEPQKTTPPGLPLDNNVFILLFFALTLGLYKVYQFKKYKKTPN